MRAKNCFNSGGSDVVDLLFYGHLHCLRGFYVRLCSGMQYFMSFLVLQLS